MKLFGFALLPKVDVQKEIISFRQRYSDAFFGPMISLSENLPHISILQCPFNAKTPVEKIIKNANKQFQKPIILKWDKLIYQPVGWVFANVQKNDVISSIQAYLLNESGAYIDQFSIDRSKSTKGYTEKEVEYYFKYGYRYIGDAYKPHVTIGRIDEATEIPEIAITDFNNHFAGLNVEFDRIAYYEAGEFGVAKRILF